MKDFDDLWRGVKAELGHILNEKCWFCETPVPRSDNAVDHFRPKGRVSDAARAHAGYGWLAFDPDNFRFACTLCNSRRVDAEHGTAGGKADRFPLLDESCRVYSVDPAELDYATLSRTTDAEQPLILDPCAPEDWLLLGCRLENGEPCATTDDPVAVQRVEASIDVYHLAHDSVCKLRHTVAGQLHEAVNTAKEHFLAVRTGDAVSERRFVRSLERVKRMLGWKKPYSGEMRFVLRGFRSPDHPWIARLLGDPD